MPHPPSPGDKNLSLGFRLRKLGCLYTGIYALFQSLETCKQQSGFLIIINLEELLWRWSRAFSDPLWSRLQNVEPELPARWRRTTARRRLSGCRRSSPPSRGGSATTRSSGSGWVRREEEWEKGQLEGPWSTLHQAVLHRVTLHCTILHKTATS